VVERVLRHPDRRLTAWLRHSLECLTEALAIQTPLVSAAEFHPAAGARGLHRLLEICRREGATDYLNAEGGRALYDPAAFSAQGLRLHFVEHIPRPYPQRGGPFVDRLSIIDALMWNNPASLERLLGDCLLVPARATESGGVRPPAAPS
jgi:hypothetical protein